eukprot:g4393.t1
MRATSFACMGIKAITSASVKLQRRLTSLEHVSKIQFSFDAFDPSMKGQREFHRRCVGRKVFQTNPKCEIIVNQKEDMSKPVTKITFSDGHEISMETADMKYEDIAEVLNGHVMTLSLKQIEMEGEKYAQSLK